MAVIPRKPKKLSGVKWAVTDGYLTARSDVGLFRVKLPGMHAFEQAVSVISQTILSKRYAARH